MRAPRLALVLLAWSSLAHADDPAPNPGAFRAPHTMPARRDPLPVADAISAAAAAASAAQNPDAPRPPAAANVNPPPLPPAKPNVVVLAPAPTPALAPAAPKKHRPRKPAPPPLPSPDLRLTVDAPSPEGAWTVRAENAGTVVVRLAADVRLLGFDVTPPESDPPARGNAKRTVRCDLPAEMRAQDVSDRSLVVPPGAAYVEKVDPRLYCFGEKAAAALVAGATVVPRLTGTRDEPVVEPLEAEPAAPARFATLAEAVGVEATIGAGTAAAAPKEPSASKPMGVSSAAFVDASRGPEAEVLVTVRNESSAPVTVLVRPETITFDVTGPTGIGMTDPSPTVHCAWPGATPSPIAEAFTRLAPKESTSMTVLLDAMCPSGTLRRPGLYTVRTKLDTQHVSGRTIGLRTFDGEAASAQVTRLRVRQWTGTVPPSPRPVLAAPPAAPAH